VSGRRAAALRRVSAHAAGLALCCSVMRAQAAEGAWQAGARLGVAWLHQPGLGPALDAYVRRGVSESLDLDLQVLGSFHPFQLDSKSRAGVSEKRPPWALGIVPGISYRWDVFQLVPYAGLGVGFYSSAGGQFGASGRVGLDYLLSRSVVLSVQASAHVVSAEGLIPWLQFGVGAAHSWGW
jgi:hypothetical protein